MIFLLIAWAAVFGLVVGLSFGVKLFDTKPGWVFCLGLCTGIFALVIAQFWFWGDWRLIRAAVLGVVLLMSMCTGGSVSPRNLKPEMTKRQATGMLTGIVAVASLFVLAYPQ